jgi:hypothetical protein
MKHMLPGFLLVASQAAWAQSLEPGQWEFTNILTLQGMPKPQTQTLQRCVTREEAADPRKWLGQRADQAECKVDFKEKTPSALRWEISCPKQGMTGTGSARIGRGTLESDQTMRGTMQGRPFEMHMKMSGRRLGACKS